MHRQEFTAFCQQSDGRGTFWISGVEIDQAEEITSDEDIEAAKLAARKECAADWGADDCSDIHCLGLAKGDVQIVMWSDLGDD